MIINDLTLKAVEAREQIEHEDPGWSPGEEAHGPREAQQQGQTGCSLQVEDQPTAAPGWAVHLHVADLDKNHHENLRETRMRMMGEARPLW